MSLGFIASGPGRPSPSGPAPSWFGIFPLLFWPLPSPWAVPDVNHRSAPLLTPPNPTFYPLLHYLPQPKAHPSHRDGIFWESPFPKDDICVSLEIGSDFSPVRGAVPTRPFRERPVCATSMRSFLIYFFLFRETGKKCLKDVAVVERRGKLVQGRVLTGSF